VRLLPPDFEAAFEALGNERFDAILFSDVLQHIAHPARVLVVLQARLASNGVVLGSVPNLDPSRRLAGRLVAQSNKWSALSGSFDRTALNLTSARLARHWLKSSRLQPLRISLEGRAMTSRLRPLAAQMPRRIVASNVVFVAARCDAGAMQ
jgi:hypothetical protein